MAPRIGPRSHCPVPQKILVQNITESTWFWPLVKPSNQKMLRSIVLSLLLCALALANDRVQITTIHEGDRVSIPKAGYVSVPFPLLFLLPWFGPTPTSVLFSFEPASGCPFSFAKQL